MGMRRWLVMVAMGMVACGSAEVPVLPAAEGFGGSLADPADSGADPTDDREGAVLRVEVVGDLPGLAVNLHSVVLGAESDAPFELADGVRDGSFFALAVDGPDDRWLWSLDDDTIGMVALPFAYIDDDENGVHTPEEQYVGLAPEGALYIEGEPSDAFVERGFGSGWNSLAVDIETGELTVHPGGVEQLTLSPQLIPQDRFVMDVQLAMEGDGLRVAMVPGTVLSGEVSGPIVFDQAATEQVQVPVDGPAPDEHLQDAGADGTQYRDWRYSVESLLVYADDNASGGFDLGDSIAGSLCAMGSQARLQHTSEPDKAFEALHLAANQIIPAWSLYVEGADGGRYVRLDDAGPLTLASNCSP